MDFASVAEKENVSTLTEHVQHLAHENVKYEGLQPLPGSWNQHSANQILIAGGKWQLKIPCTICSGSEKLVMLCSSLLPALRWDNSMGERRSLLAGTCWSCLVSLGAAARWE